MEIRSFLAFELPEEIKGIVSRVSGEMKKPPLDIRWIRVDNIHLTIIFIGNITTDRLDGMNTIVRDVCRDHGPFNISLKGAGVFSSRRNPRVLWVGLSGDMERMSLFKEALEKGLRPFGIQEEKRRFNPHLTLGRFRKDAKSGAHLDALLLKYGDLTSPVCTLSKLALFKSDLKPGGSVYTKLNAWPLAGEDKNQ
jgi:RNA 2',3'-cyclic 3'-phosphodiesterase